MLVQMMYMSLWWIPDSFQFRDPNKWPTLIETNRAARQKRRENRECEEKLSTDDTLVHKHAGLN